MIPCKKQLVTAMLVLSFIAAGISSCKKSSALETTNETGRPAGEAPASSLVVTPEHPGRALASNCFQCHGTNGNGYEELAGSDASGIIHDMNEMATKNVGENIMNVHARAYTQQQVALIADFFSRQPSNH